MDFGIWGSGTRLRRPKEPGGGASFKEPGARAGRPSSPVALAPSKDPFRPSLIGEKSNIKKESKKKLTRRDPN